VAVLFAYGVLAWTLWSTRGHFETKGIAGLAVAWLLLALPLPKKFPSWFVIAAAAIFAYLLQRDLRLLYALPQWERGLRALALLGGLAVVAHVRFGLVAWGVALGCLLDVSLLVPLASPNPAIDVFVASREAIEFALSGKPVYSGGYAEIYGGKYGYEPGFNYWPMVLYYLMPFHVLVGDLRWGLVAAHVLSFAMLYRWGDRKVALLWLALPVGPFVLEQAWNEPLIVLLTYLFFLFWTMGREKSAAVALGALLATKQYLLPFAALTFLWMYRAEGREKTLRAFALSAVTFAVLLLPFLLREPAAFYHTTIAKVLDFPYREDSLNFTTFFVRQGWTVGQGIRRAIIAGVFYLAAFRIYRRPDATTWALGSAFFYLTVFSFGNHAFCNYYYWVLGLLVLPLAFCTKHFQAPAVYSSSPG